MNRRLALLSVLAPLALAGCTKDITYSYFVIELRIDTTSVDEELLNRVAAASLEVTGADLDNVDLGWRQGFENPNAIGTAEWSTSVESGEVKFVFTGYDFNRNAIIRGESPTLMIRSDMTQSTVVTARPTRPQTDAGADASVGDGGTGDGGVVDAAGGG